MSTKLDEAVSRLSALQTQLQEALSYDSSNLNWMDPRDLGIGDTPGFYPTTPWGPGLAWLERMKRGEFIPAFLNEHQLSVYRRRIRAMAVNNEIALNVINIYQAYGVGEGFQYEATPRRPEYRSFVDAAQVIIDANAEYNEMDQIESEVAARLLIDGEAFLRVFPRANGLMAIRFIEPEHVRAPQGATRGNIKDEYDDSFGIRTLKTDVESVLGYWVVQGIPDEGAKPEFVDASEVIHFKHQETPSTSKRGLSPFFAVETTLRAVEDLLNSTVALAKSRAKIAWIRKLQQATVDVATALIQAQASVKTTDPQTGDQINAERYRYGSILTVPANMEIEFPGANVNAAEYSEVMQMTLRIIASRFQIPEYMLSSDASNANYSSTLVAESPFVKSMERFQGQLGKLFARNRWPGARQSIIWRQLHYAVKCGYLPQGIERVIDIQAEGPPLTVRDVIKEAQVDKIYHDMGAKSLKTIQLQQGLKPSEEEANFAQEKPRAQVSVQGIQPGGIQQPGLGNGINDSGLQNPGA